MAEFFKRWWPYLLVVAAFTFSAAYYYYFQYLPILAVMRRSAGPYFAITSAEVACTVYGLKWAVIVAIAGFGGRFMYRQLNTED